MPEKLKLHTPDLTAQNIQRIAELFPSCVTETRDGNGLIRPAIDFDQLRQELSDAIVDGPRERYHLDWPGKREAILAANAPIAKTLRPVRDESVNFDTTKNLFIEGDNLDALKLLQENYLGKIKMIYIDPPYNTGNDFIYDDDFAQNTSEYLNRSNQQDESGGRLVTNSEANGRFHSDWLVMMYSRLKLARNLLQEQGAIFISIDEKEIQNLRALCNEVFGERCFAGLITLLCNPKGRSQDKYFATNHEYVLVYSKSLLPKGFFAIAKDEEQIEAEYPEEDEAGKYRVLELRNTHREFGRHNRRNMFYPLYASSDGEVFLQEGEDRAKVLPIWDDGFEGCWTWDKNKAERDLDLLTARRVNGAIKIFRKSYASGAERMLKTVLIDRCFYTERGQKEFNNLFGTKTKLFQSPKSPYLLAQLLQTITSGDDIILDFFAGSGSMGQAILMQNKDDGGNRRFILVQLPQDTPTDSPAANAGFKTIADLTKERLRRAGDLMREEAGLTTPALDTGFRVLKIDTSNMRDVYYTPDAVQQGTLLDHIDNIRPDRTPEDLLFQVLVDWGIDLALPINTEQLNGKTVFFVDGNGLAACFDAGVDDELVKQIAKRKPLRAVFRDMSYGSDSVKINVDQIFRLLSPDTEVRTL